MIKKIILAAILINVIFSGVCFAGVEKEGIQNYLKDQINSLNISEFDTYIQDSEIMKDTSIKTFIMDVIKGKKSIFNLFDKDKIINFFVSQIKLNIKIFTSILVLALLSSVLKNLDNSFSSSAISTISNYVIFIIIISLSFVIFKDILNVAQTAMNNMVNFMEVIIPIEIAFLVTIGLPIASTILSPILLGIVIFINMIFKKFLFFIITFSFSILIINHISKNIKLKQLLAFAKQINIFSISAIFTVYLSIISIQGIYVTSFDKFSVKAAKFMLGNFIPVVGGFISDSLDIILSSSNLLKSLIGSIGLVILVGICLLPVIKILSVVIMFKVLSIIIEPISDESISSYLSELSGVVMMMLIAVLAIAVIFFITISVLASIGSAGRV